MSSDLQSALASVLMNNYSTVAIVTAVSYDYILTLPEEIKYIWNRPWTWISTIFGIVRYIGIFCAITGALVGSTFVPGPVKICTAIYSAGNSTFVLFLSAADLVMLLRVYALCGRSRIILGILLVVYAAAVVLLVISTALFTNPKSMQMATPEILTFSFCATEYTKPSAVGTYAFVPRFVLGALMCILAIVQFLRESLQMYNITKQWQLNRYLNLLVREGVLYFIVNVLYNIISLVNGSASEGEVIAMTAFSYAFLYMMMPRFIINVRELATRNVRGDMAGIDSGFGVVSRATGRNAGAEGNIVFAAVGTSEGSMRGGEMRREEITSRSSERV